MVEIEVQLTVRSKKTTEVENVMNITKREAENSKKFAIQNFVRVLLDVVDILGRAASVTKESFSKIDESKDASGGVPHLKTLLQEDPKMKGDHHTSFPSKPFDAENDNDEDGDGDWMRTDLVVELEGDGGDRMAELAIQNQKPEVHANSNRLT